MVVNNRKLKEMSIAELEAMREYIKRNYETFAAQYSASQLDGALMEIGYHSKDKLKECFQMVESKE